jgi:hypothetical protein
MERWRIKPSSLIVLASVVFVMLVIVYLPDVDLLDTAFQRGTAPITIHALATSAPAAVSVPTLFQPSRNAAEGFRHFHVLKNLAVYSAPNFLPILLRSIRR